MIIKAFALPPGFTSDQLTVCEAQNIKFLWVVNEEHSKLPTYLVTAMLPISRPGEVAPRWVVTDVCDLIFHRETGSPSSEFKTLKGGAERDGIEEYVAKQLNTVGV